MASPSHQELLAVVREAMSASRAGERRLRMGVEMEFIPVSADSGTRVPLDSEGDAPSATRLLREVATRQGWTEERSPHGIPCFRVPGLGLLTFEPGGQLELSTDAFDAVRPLISGSRSALRSVFEVAGDHGIELVARGLDPFNAAADTPLWVQSERYRKQSAHYASLGPWGRRMMLQSAAIHVNLDLGGRPVRRWWAANRMAPHLVALFANSPMVANQNSGYRSSRAEQWRHLDPSRTGLFSESEDPVGDYTRFALDAKAFLASAEGDDVLPFRTLWEQGAGLDAWRAHLTTLFPEVRPRGYLELRSIDALPPRWIAVPLVLCVGILYAPKALAQAVRVLPDATGDRLLTAGRSGLGDSALRKEAETLFDLAFEGAAELGEDVVGGEALEEARAFRDRFIARGEDPGHESHDGDPFEI